MGERDHFILMEMASIGMEMMAEWGASTVAQRLAMLTDRIADGVHGLGVSVPARNVRAPHVLSLGFKDGMPAKLIEGLAADRIHVASRLGRLRLPPHVYHHEARARRLVPAPSKRL